ncbi:MAG: hypothetical protein KGZ58_13110 [Ignavibacteriales bacterium]|nr:hypothetical protein [Ignavibacteriales bacterium]
MKHLTFIQLNQYVDSEILSHQRKEVEDHLHECASCRTQVESLQSLDVFLRTEFPVETVSPNFTQRIMVAISQKPLFSLVWKPLALFAVIFIVNAIIIFQPGASPEIQSPVQPTHLVDILKNYISTGVHIFSLGTSKYFSSFKGGMVSNVLFIALSLGIGFLLDRFILAPMYKRKVSFFPKGN